MKSRSKRRPMPAKPEAAKPDKTVTLAQGVLAALDGASLGEAAGGVIAALGLIYCQKYPTKAEAMMAGQGFGAALADFIDRQWATSRAEGKQ